MKRKGKPKELSLKERMERGRKLLDTKPEPPIAATKAMTHNNPRSIARNTAEKPKANLNKGELSPQEMLQVDLIEYAWELKCRRSLTLREISNELQEKYNLPEKPALSTVGEWLKKSWAFRTNNIGEFEEQVKNEIYGQYIAVLNRWLPIALGENIPILGTRVVNGVEVQCLEENAYDEQIKAAHLVLKTWNQICITMGIGKQIKGDIETLGQKELLSIVMSVNNFIHPPSKDETVTIDVETERLELESGIPHIDSL